MAYYGATSLKFLREFIIMQSEFKGSKDRPYAIGTKKKKNEVQISSGSMRKAGMKSRLNKYLNPI
jgi:uncharacterized protein YabE (DUF348 family)